MDDEAAMMYERMVNDANTHVDFADLKGPTPPANALTDERSAEEHASTSPKCYTN